MEVAIENLSKIYEDEEREIHYREQTDKKRRVRSTINYLKVYDLGWNKSKIIISKTDRFWVWYELK